MPYQPGEGGTSWVEELMVELGVGRYQAQVKRAKEKKRESKTTVGRYLLREAMATMSEAITDTLAKLSDNRPGTLNLAYRYIRQFDPDLVAFYVCQIILDEISSSQREVLNVSLKIAKALEDYQRFSKLQEIAEIQYRKMMKRVKISSESHKRKALRGLSRHLDKEFKVWPTGHKLSVGGTLLDLFCHSTGLTKLIMLPDKFQAPGQKIRMKRYVHPRKELVDWMEKAHERHELLNPFHLPTIHPPARWTDARDGGYASNIITQSRIISGYHTKATDGIYNDKEMPEVFRGLNLIQDTAWAINKRVLEVARGCWEQGHGLGGLPTMQGIELPPKPADIATNEEAKKAWKVATSAAYRRQVSERCRRLLASKIFYMAELYENEPRFHYPHHLDFRGRTYPYPGFLTPQGTDLAKGLLQFDKGMEVTHENSDLLAIHGANCFGFDKKPLEERIQWAKDAHGLAIAIAKDPFQCKTWADADEPWQFLAWCFDWAELYETGKVNSAIPVAIDGTNNGLQLFSLLLRDPVLAQSTNCIAADPEDQPFDIYQDVSDHATESLRTEMTTTEDEKVRKLCQDLLGFFAGKLPRSASKRPVMIYPYGGTFYGIVAYTLDFLEDECEKRKEHNMPDALHAHAFCLSRHLWEGILGRIAPAKATMDWLRNTARIATKNGVAIEWRTPSNFVVRQQYRKNVTKEIDTLLGHRIGRLRMKYREERPGDLLSPRSQANGISPNFIHSLDASIMTLTACRAADKGVTHFAMVHDSFGTHAAHAQTMWDTVREVTTEMFSEDLLEDFRAQVQARLPEGVELPPCPPLGNHDVSEVLRSPYFFS